MKYIFELSSRASMSESAEDKHNSIIQAMRFAAQPWGLQDKGIEVPPVNFGNEFTCVIQLNKFFINGIKCTLFYRYRNNLYDHHSCDDRIYFEFNDSKIDYLELLNTVFPWYVSKFAAYKAHVFPHDLIYADFEKSRNINLRQKMFRFYPAVYMDNELCKRVLGKTAIEVVEILKNVIERAEVINNGALLITTSNSVTIELCDELDKKMRSCFLVSN